MGLLSSTVSIVRSYSQTLKGRVSLLRSQLSDGRLIDQRTIFRLAIPLANSARSPLSDGVVDSLSNPTSNNFRSNGSLVNNYSTFETGSLSQVSENKTSISSDPLAISVRSPPDGILADLPAYQFTYCPYGKKTTELGTNFVKSLSHVETTMSSDPLAKVELIPENIFRPVETVQTALLSDPFANVELIPDDTFGPAKTVKTGFAFLFWGETLDHDLDFAVRSTKTFINHILFCEDNTGIVYKPFAVISNHFIFETCSIDTKLKILSAVYDRIRNNCQPDPQEVYLMNTFLKSMSNDDSKKDMTKDEVTSRVLDVIQSYPKVGARKVTEETCFNADLGFLRKDCITVRKALYLEFRLNLRPMRSFEISCEEIIDYYYGNQMKRMAFEEFRAENISGQVFWLKNGI